VPAKDCPPILKFSKLASILSGLENFIGAADSKESKPPVKYISPTPLAFPDKRFIAGDSMLFPDNI